MRILRAILLLASTLGSAASAQAEAPSYRYVDVGYQFGGDIEVAPGGSADLDGFVVRASVPLTDRFFGNFDYAALGTDPSGLDITDWSIGVGWHNELFYARVGMENAELDACAVLLPPCAADDSGYNIDLGLRTMASEHVEVSAHVGRSDLGDLDTSTNFGLGAVWMFNEVAGVSVNYERRDFDAVEYTTYGLGLRWSF